MNQVVKQYLLTLLLGTYCSSGIAEQAVTLDGISIIGNKELPNVLYILPWQSPDLPNMNEPVLTGLIEKTLEPVDREAVIRMELYSNILNKNNN